MDLRLLPLALGLWLSTAGSLVVADVANPLAIVIWLICLCGICFWLITKNQFKYWNLTSTKFLILGLVLGVFLITIRIQPLISGPVAQAVNEKAVITISGEILDDPRRSKSVNGLDLSAGILALLNSKRRMQLFGAKVIKFECQFWFTFPEIN